MLRTDQHNYPRLTHWLMNSWGFLLLALFICPAALLANPIILSGEDPITNLQLKAVDAPRHIFSSSQSTQNSDWYQLDVNWPNDSFDHWLLVFPQTPHQKLDVFIPSNGGYQLRKMGTDGDHLGMAPNTLALNVPPGKTRTYYLRHQPGALDHLQTKLWPAMKYYETFSLQQSALSSIQTLLIISLIFVIAQAVKNKTAEFYLMIVHTLAANTLTLVWEGDIFRIMPWLGSPLLWLFLTTIVVFLSGIFCYRPLALLPVYAPKLDRLILSLSAVTTALTIYAVSLTTSVLAITFTVKLVAIALLCTLAVVTAAMAYCLYNGLQPAKITIPCSLTLLLLLGWTVNTQNWPQLSFMQLVPVALHGALLPLIYWYIHRQNLQHTLSISAVAPNNCNRRIFESALRKHLQPPNAPLPTANLCQRVLAVFADVLPNLPSIILCYRQGQWHLIIGENSDYEKSAGTLAKQLTMLEKDLLSIITFDSKTNLCFKDSYGNAYWAFPMDIGADEKILIVLVPSRQHRNPAIWQTASDISSHASTLFQTNRQLLYWQQQACLDGLTGLLNKEAFCHEADLTVASHIKTTEPCCVIFMDIDNFKQINDRYGHNTGDEILKKTAYLCRTTLRQEDLLGRYGGDEFVALLPNTEVGQAFRVAERIRRTIACHYASQSITVSIGIAALSRAAPTLERIIDEADKAMYQAKKAGENRTSISTNKLDARLPTNS